MAKGDDLSDRFVLFSARVIRVVSLLKKGTAATHVGRQLVRAGTAPGADYAEACGAESRNDFIHKLRLADKEARECRYWLRVVAAAWTEHGEAAAQIAEECRGLEATLTASIATARRGLGE
jgi:four helix bundle protein